MNAVDDRKEEGVLSGSGRVMWPVAVGVVVNLRGRTGCWSGWKLRKIWGWFEMN